jgi:hypothetical protein
MSGSNISALFIFAGDPDEKGGNLCTMSGMTLTT